MLLDPVGTRNPFRHDQPRRGVFARSRISRTPPQASPELSQLYHREGFPPAAGGRTHEACPAEATCEDG